MSQPFKSPVHAARSAMLNGQILPHGVQSKAVLSAFSSIPRERFVPDTFQNRAYSDGLIPLDSIRWMLPPMIMARMIDAAHIKPDDHLLTIGCGTGYMAILLSMISKKVVAVDDRPLLIEKAIAIRADLSDVAGSVDFKINPLNLGYPPMGPYDGIFLEGCVPCLPPLIADQLTPGGRAVVLEKPKMGPLWAEGALYHKNRDGITRTPLFTLPAPHLCDFYPREEETKK